MLCVVILCVVAHDFQHNVNNENGIKKIEWYSEELDIRDIFTWKAFRRIWQ
jgi:hypothetical protein